MSDPTPTSVVERLAEDMVRRWRAGERPTTESYLDRFPELRDSPEAALELIAEELTLREECGLPTSPSELATRFPKWQAQVRALANCHDALGPHIAPRYPAVGETIDGFHLDAELGRGAHGRVFRATQTMLGRRVVLKLTPLTGREHLALARLQHTHIVPLFSVHEFTARGLRGLCMPDFGGRTLSTPPAPDAAEIVRIGACLADALHDAHKRGLLHLDIKPSNVLIAADGTPMLLDFHLARPPVAAGSLPPAGLGGTPAYMAPEHRAAMSAAREGKSLPFGLDARTDLFSLGRVLSDLLGGRGSKGLSDILARCTAPDPNDRYGTAAALAEDLRRHAADLPLRGVRNRSVTERWRKWRRRKPLALPLILVVTLLGFAASGLVVRANRAADRALVSSHTGEAHLAAGRFAEASEAFRGGESVLEGVPMHGELRARLRDGRLAAERGQTADELHAVCDRLRPLYAAEQVSPEQLLAVVSRCRQMWAQREQLAAALTGQPERDRRWRADLFDLAVLLAHAEPRVVPSDEKPAAHRRALDLLDEAERLLGPCVALDLERATHARALGLHDEARKALSWAASTPPQSASDYLALGRAALATGERERAVIELTRALDREPANFWANYYLGVCRLRTHHAAEALAAFSTCAALAPDRAWCFHNRGLAFAEMGKLDLARADFDRALSLDPTLAVSRIARASVHYRGAVELMAANDRAAATSSLRACLADDPTHAAAKQLLDRLTNRP